MEGWGWIIVLCGLMVAYLVGIRKLRPNFYLAPQDSLMAVGDPSYKAVIHGVLVCDTSIPLHAFTEATERALSRFDRFRKRIVRRDWLWSYWQDVADFRFADHIVHFRFPDGENSNHHLQLYVSKLLITPLDPVRPLWQFHLLQNYMGGRTVFVPRLHHALGDGISLLKVALTLMQPLDPSKPFTFPSAHKDKHNSHNPTTTTTTTNTITTKASKKPTKHDAVTSLSSRTHHLVDAFVSIVRSSMKLLVLPADPVSLWRTDVPLPPDSPIRVSWNGGGSEEDPTMDEKEQTIDLSDVKRIAQQCNVSVNDVLFSVLAGTLRRYALLRAANSSSSSSSSSASSSSSSSSSSSPPSISSPQCVLWVSLRGLDPTSHSNSSVDSGTGSSSMGNHIGAVYLSLPMSEPDPLRRLSIVHASTRELAKSPEPYLSNLFMQAIGLLPMALALPIWRSLAFKVSLSMSNLPGPSEQLCLVGSPVSQLTFFVSPQYLMPHFVTIISYNKRISFGLASDERLVPDPERVVQLFQLEFKELLHTVSLQVPPPSTT